MNRCASTRGRSLIHMLHQRMIGRCSTPTTRRRLSLPKEPSSLRSTCLLSLKLDTDGTANDRGVPVRMERLGFTSMSRRAVSQLRFDFSSMTMTMMFTDYRWCQTISCGIARSSHVIQTRSRSLSDIIARVGRAQVIKLGC